jgi:hypothetical protein
LRGAGGVHRAACLAVAGGRKSLKEVREVVSDRV